MLQECEVQTFELIESTAHNSTHHVISKHATPTSLYATRRITTIRQDYPRRHNSCPIDFSYLYPTSHAHSTAPNAPDRDMPTILDTLTQAQSTAHSPTERHYPSPIDKSILCCPIPALSTPHIKPRPPAIPRRTQTVPIASVQLDRPGLVTPLPYLLTAPHSSQLYEPTSQSVPVPFNSLRQLRTRPVHSIHADTPIPSGSSHAQSTFLDMTRLFLPNRPVLSLPSKPRPPTNRYHSARSISTGLAITVRFVTQRPDLSLRVRT